MQHLNTKAQKRKAIAEVDNAIDVKHDAKRHLHSGNRHPDIVKLDETISLIAKEMNETLTPDATKILSEVTVSFIADIAALCVQLPDSTMRLQNTSTNQIPITIDMIEGIIGDQHPGMVSKIDNLRRFHQNRPRR